ncbi:MAG TPA: AAA family ATPase, partial [Flavobacterium sp.]
MTTLISAADYVLRFINQTNKSLFLTGNAGTGKTTLLREIIRTTHKNTVVVAPTGIAALNAGGVTIHSMFQLPFSPFIPEERSAPIFSNGLKFETAGSLRRHFRMSAMKQAVLLNMELLVIDEVSMLRADVLDAIEVTLQVVRKNNRPLGGVQVLFIGDLLQLPPVVKNDEWNVLKDYYSGKFFFHSKTIANAPVLYIELTKIYRQTDSTFISLLNNLRNNIITDLDLKTLNQYYDPGFDVRSDGSYITLTTHNSKADAINATSLEELYGNSEQFNAEITGDFPEKIFPVDEVLCLKEGARVMFIKNDLSAEKQYFNGKTGIVKHISEGEVHIFFANEGLTIEVEKYEWSNVRYYVDPMSNEVREEVLGTFVQYPLKLAWA